MAKCDAIMGLDPCAGDSREPDDRRATSLALVARHAVFSAARCCHRLLSPGYWTPKCLDILSNRSSSSFSSSGRHVHRGAESTENIADYARRALRRKAPAAYAGTRTMAWLSSALPSETEESTEPQQTYCQRAETERTHCGHRRRGRRRRSALSRYFNGSRRIGLHGIDKGCRPFL